VAVVAARISVGVPALPCRPPARVALKGLTPASLTFGARLRPTLVVPARAGLGFVFAAAAPRALGVVAVLAAFPREVPDPLVSAAAGLGAAFGAAAPRFAPATLPLMVAPPEAGAPRPFRGAAVLEAIPPAAPAVLARAAAAGFAAAFGAPVRPLAAVPWPPVLAAAVAGAPRRFGVTLVLLPPFAGASAVRAFPAAGFIAVLPRAGAPAGTSAPLPVPGAARLAGLFLPPVGFLAIGSPRSFADVAPNHPRPLPGRGQAGRSAHPWQNPLLA
jgi:hypothetical protein